MLLELELTFFSFKRPFPCEICGRAEWFITVWYRACVLLAALYHVRNDAQRANHKNGGTQNVLDAVVVNEDADCPHDNADGSESHGHQDPKQA